MLLPARERTGELRDSAAFIRGATRRTKLVWVIGGERRKPKHLSTFHLGSASLVCLRHLRWEISSVRMIWGWNGEAAYTLPLPHSSLTPRQLGRTCLLRETRSAALASAYSRLHVDAEAVLLASRQYRLAIRLRMCRSPSINTPLSAELV